MRANLKRSVVFAAVLVALVLAGPAAPSSASGNQAAADQAIAYQQDAAHDGSIADAGLSAPLAQAWSVTLSSNLSYPLIVDGMVFVTSADKTVYALNQATGATIWSHGVGGTYGVPGVAYDRGQVFVVNSSGLLTAFDATSGAIAWSKQLPGQYMFTSPPTATNGIVYTGGAGSGGTLYATRESDGQLLWTGYVANGDHSSPAVTAQGVYVSYACQVAYDFDPLSGSVLWTHTSSCSGGGGRTPVVADGHVLVRDWALAPLILSASTGAVQGPLSAGPAPAAANGVAFLLNGSTLTAVAGDGLGTNNWTFAGDGHLTSAPVVAGGVVYEGSSSGNLYALDATTGATTWSTNVGAAINAPDEQNAVPLTGLAAANGTLIVPAGSTLMAYRSAGAITDVPSNQSLPTIGGSGKIYEAEAADVGMWSGLPSAYAYQWELCDGAGANCSDIAGANGPSFTPPASDLGSTLRVRVTATNGVGSSTPFESAASAALTGTPSPPTLMTSPVVSGTTAVGSQLSTTNGNWTNLPTGYQYKWQRCDGNGANCVDIPSATSAQYTLVAADVDHDIRSEVLASNPSGPAAAGYAPSAPTYAVVASGPGNQVASDQATAYQQDAAHDGSIADAGLTAPLAPAWSVALPGTSSYPLIANGMVFVTAGDKTVYALNQATGAIVWSHGVGGTYGVPGLAYDRGQIFVVNSSGLLTAFDAATGAIAWSNQLPVQYMFTSPPTATNGIVYTGGAGSGGTLYAVRESDGHLLWTQGVANGDHSSPAVTAQGVYVSYACQVAAAFDPLLGTNIWAHTTGCSGGGGKTPVVADGHVYVRDDSLGDVVLSASNGAAQGSLNAGPAPAIANGVAFMRSGSTLTAAAADGLGANNWTFTGDGHLTSAPVVAGGLVYEGSSSGNLYALDAGTGATTWSTNVGAAINAPDEQNAVPLTGLAAANGTLIVPSGSILTAYRSAGAITSAPTNTSPPTVGGSGAVGDLQAADVGMWSGLPNAYSYQWELCNGAGANCSDIAGANGPSFAPPAADLGSTLRVSVTATNGVGSSTPVESAASGPLGAANMPPTLSTAPVLSGTATVGQQLATTNGNWTNAPTSYQYKWQRCDNTGSNCADIANATSALYTLVAADSGHEIRSEVRAANAYGSASSYAPSAPTSVVTAVPTLTTPPAVSGTAAVGQQLSTSNGTWANGPTGYAYKWERCDTNGANCVDIASATSPQYTIVSADTGHELRSAVLATNATGPATGYALSAPTSVVPAAVPAISTPPVVSGAAGVGLKLSTTNGTWTNAPTTYLYKWQRCDNAGSNCVDIPNATASHYTLVDADLGHRIRSEVLASNALGLANAYAPSAATAAVVHKPVVFSVPTLFGRVKVGKSLSVTTGSWKYSPASYAYQWYRCSALGASCKKIAAATSSSYVLAGADAGHKLKATVTASNAGGSGTATSALSAKAHT